MSRIIDFHSHILPGIDDGSASLKESIAMLKMAAAQGIEHVVATPHFYPQYDTPERFLTRRNEAEARLRERMERYPGLPKLTVGAEVYFFSGIQYTDVLAGLTIGKNNCILIEMPDSPWSDSMYRELEQIQVRRGLIPVIAHVDRYIRPFHTHGIPKRLEELPVLVQANASFFLRNSTRRMALQMLRRDQIHLLGSDCHNMTTRPPNLSEAVQVIGQHLGAGALRRIASYQADALGGRESIHSLY